MGEATITGAFSHTEHAQTTQKSRTPHAHKSDEKTKTTTQRTAGKNDEDASKKSNPARSFDSSRYHANADTYKSKKRGLKMSVGSKSLRKKLIIGASIVAAVALVAIGAYVYETQRPVTVTINGEEQTIQGAQRSLIGLVNTETVSVTAGNYIAVDNSIIEEGGGTQATATLNDESVEDLSTPLNEGDVVTITDGVDVMEDYTESEPQVAEPTIELTGVGAVHLYTSAGEPGEKIVRTGKDSGISVDIITEEPVNGEVVCYNVDTRGEKVIALTFDDGPWDETTEEILDILKQYNAKATFFTVGNRISGREDLVKRAVNEGHEVGTHTYDHAQGSGEGVSLILMSTEERQEEVEKGLQAIEDATGEQASTMFRSPGGNFDNSVATDLYGMIVAEIGWNIDTGDWQQPGADVIAERIESADPGEIILLHDGGGDRSQTVEALEKALPKLVEEGYSFVTVEDLINSYPLS